MWTRFMDMHSGGRTKEPPYEWIYIELPQKEAEVYFQNRFGHNPYRVTCTCCGEDYSISSEEDLRGLTEYDRGCKIIKKKGGKWDPDDPVIKKKYYYEEGEKPPSGYILERGTHNYQTLEEYCEREDVLVIRASEIDPEMVKGELTKQGYIWVD